MNETLDLSQQPGMFFGHGTGARIDTLESLFNAFSPQNAEGHAALRRETDLLRAEARRAGIPVIAEAAEAAFQAEPAQLHDLTSKLITLMRDHARGSHPSQRPAAEDIDPETGVMNRDAFMRALNHCVHIERAPVAVAAIHVDSFQSLRHRHGDDIASMLIAHVAGIVTRQLRENDCVAHFSGDEFMILLHGEDERGLHATLARLEEAVLNRPFRLPGGGTQETVRLSSSGHKLGQTDSTARGTATDLALLRIGHIIRTSSIRQAAVQILKRNGCEPVEPGRTPASRYAPFAHHGAQLVLLECDASDLAMELMQLRIALMHDRTPVLVIAANETSARWAIEHGAADAIVKPLDMNALLTVAIRLASRGRKVTQPDVPATPARVLVASDDLYDLIALGSALQKQGGYEVRLAHGSADAARQLERHQPSTALIDLRLWRSDAQQFLDKLAENRPGRPIVLITNKGENLAASAARLPRVAGTIEKPVRLLTLAGEFHRATGIGPSHGNGNASEIFREELLRVMRNSGPAAVAPP